MKFDALKLVAVGLCTLVFPVVAFAQERYEIKPCAFSKAPKRATGINLILTLPPGVKLRRGKDHDYLEFRVEHRSNGKVSFLQGMWGPNSTSGRPPKWLTSASRSIELREWRYESREGVDVKGVAEDGTRWRYLGTYGEFLGYEGVSIDAAKFFDSLLDNVCFLAEKRK
ncbi:MAG TPA: hypothetical protein PKE66_00855 [Pyrinomonadaceae bacterium]|nr:hypothetical protein [Pyrinomonadaceae bacterium]